eukprot:4431687-Prymnesium_polylepis.1
MRDPRTTCNPRGLERAHRSHAVGSAEPALLMAPQLVALSSGRPIKQARSATREHNLVDG